MNAIIENRKTLKKAKLVSPNIQDIFVDEYDACKRRIRDGIRRRLKFSPSELSDKKEAVRVFADDLEKLTKMHRQWCELVTVLARTHCKTKGLETLPPPLRKELTFGLNSAFAKAKRAGFKRANCLGAELLKGNSETVVAALIASLRNMTYDLVEEVFEGLEFLKNECILGKITWTHDDACFFDHWNHSVEAEGFHEDTRKTQYVRRPVQEDNLDVLWVNVETKTTSREGKYIHRAEQLEQHLMGAERSSLKNCKAIIPRHLNSIVEKIPQFLRSEIVVVTGEQFVVNRFQRVFETDLFKDTVEKKVRIHNDPAIVLGNTVLAAWDDDACHQERRDRLDDSKKQAGIISGGWAVVAAMFSVSSYLIIGTANFGSATLFVACLALSTYLANESMSDWHQFKRREFQLYSRVRLLFGWFLFVFATCMTLGGLVNSHWLPLLAGLAAIPIASSALRSGFKPTATS